MGLDEEPSTGTDDGMGLDEELLKKLDKGPVDGAGQKAPGVGTDNGAGLAEGLAELKERRSEVEAMKAELNKSNAGRQRGRQETRPGIR